MSDRESPSASVALPTEVTPTLSLEPPDRPAWLLARLLNTSPAAAATTLEAAGGLASFTMASDSDLVALGLTRRRAMLLRDAFELARFGIGIRPTVGVRLGCGSDVWTHIRARLCGLPVEEFWAIALDVRHRVIFERMLARGSLTGVEVHPRDVFRPLIRSGAAAVIFAHNHPSGNPSPSRADIELTGRLREVGELCGIVVLDHVVVATEGYASLAERAWR